MVLNCFKHHLFSMKLTMSLHPRVTNSSNVRPSVHFCRGYTLQTPSPRLPGNEGAASPTVTKSSDSPMSGTGGALVMPNSVYDVYIRALWLMNNISKCLHLAVVCLMNIQADVFFLMV